MRAIEGTERTRAEGWHLRHLWADRAHYVRSTSPVSRSYRQKMYMNQQPSCSSWQWNGREAFHHSCRYNKTKETDICSVIIVVCIKHHYLMFTFQEFLFVQFSSDSKQHLSSFANVHGIRAQFMNSGRPPATVSVVSCVPFSTDEQMIMPSGPESSSRSR